MWSKKPATDAPPYLDTAYLERLQKHLGEDVTRELMADGMLELSDRLDRVEHLAEKQQVGELRRLTHDIAGAAGHLGLSALSFHAAEANRALRDDSPQPAKGVMKAMLECRAQSLDSLAAFCKIGVGQLADHPSVS